MYISFSALASSPPLEKVVLVSLHHDLDGCLLTQRRRFPKGSVGRPNTERLRSITATELAGELGFAPEGAGVRTWCVNEHDNVLMFNPAAVVLGNHVG